MSTTGGTEAGTVLVLDEPAAIRKKFGSAVTDSGREVRRGEDKPGITNLIDILAVARGIGQDEVEREFEGAGYGDFKKAVAEGVVELLAPVRERYAELRPDEAALEAVARRRRREGARDRRSGRSPTCASAWASARPPNSAAKRRLRVPPPRLVCADGGRRARPRPRHLRRAVRPADGGRPARGGQPARPAAGRGRRRLRRAPRARGRAGAGGGDRVPRPDRRPAGAEVAADAAGPRGRARRARPRRGGRGAAGADARVPPLPRRLRACSPSASRASAATSTARRRCRWSCAGSRSTPPPPSTTPTRSAPPSATC